MADYTYEVETDQGRAQIVTNAPVTSNQQMQQLISQQISSKGLGPSQAAPEAPVDLQGAVESVGKPVIGPLVAGMAPYAAPIGGAMLGGARGAALGAPLGPLGAAGMGVVGAGLGAMTGQGVNEAVDVAEGAPLTGTLGERAGRMLVEGGSGATGQAVGTVVAGVLKLLHPKAMSAAAQAGYQTVVNTAQRIGVDLTAAEQTGRPFLKIAEGIVRRGAGGSNTMRQFDIARGEQLGQAADTLGEKLLGQNLLDGAARTNRFAAALKVRIGDIKSQARTLYDDAFTMLGPQPIPLNAVKLRLAALDAEGGATGPAATMVKNALYKPIPPQSEDPVLAGIRGQLGLRPNEPLPAYLQNQLSPMTAPLDTAGAPAGMMNQPPLKPEELRRLHQLVGEVAFPKSTIGQSVADKQAVSHAQQLWGALDDDLMGAASARGPQAVTNFEDAKQFWKTTVTPLNSEFYRAVVGDKKSMAAFSNRLFNSQADSGLKLLHDAKAIVSDDGWKMIQQQYWGHRFTDAGIVKPLANGQLSFNGPQFANQVAKDTATLDLLFDPAQAKALREFADVARTAGNSGAISEMMGILIEGGQIATMGHAATSGNLAKLGKTAASVTMLPYIFARMTTTPGGTQYLTNGLKIASKSISGSTGLTAQNVAKFLGAAGGAAAGQGAISIPPIDTGAQGR